MHARRVVAAAICGSVDVAMVQPGIARASGTNDVFVNSDKTICADGTGAGSRATPFCTVPAAPASPSVVAGSTLWLTGDLTGGINITKSGVTLQAAGIGASVVGGAYGIADAGQHDVALRGRASAATRRPASQSRPRQSPAPSSAAPSRTPAGRATGITAARPSAGGQRTTPTPPRSTPPRSTPPDTARPTSPATRPVRSLLRRWPRRTARTGACRWRSGHATTCHR